MPGVAVGCDRSAPCVLHELTFLSSEAGGERYDRVNAPHVRLSTRVDRRPAQSKVGIDPVRGLYDLCHT